MNGTMRAVVLTEFGKPDVLQVRDVPIPKVEPGWVLLKVEAFGLNRSELHFRRGQGSFGSLPRIPGIEATGVVVDAPGGEFVAGTQAAALMGGMGREFDGGYAEYVTVPANNVVPFRSELPWGVLGALPEMLQTAYGSFAAIDPAPGAPLLVRGGTSSVGLAFAALASRRGHPVISTTRSASRSDVLKAAGVDHVIVDTGAIAGAVRKIVPEGVGGAIELIGTDTLRDTLRATARLSTVSFTGMLSDVWTVKDFYPIDFIPNGVRLTAYSGEASDLPASVLQEFIDDVARGAVKATIGGTYPLDKIADAHRDMENGAVAGKLVVIP